MKWRVIRLGGLIENIYTQQALTSGFNCLITELRVHLTLDNKDIW